MARYQAAWILCVINFVVRWQRGNRVTLFFPFDTLLPHSMFRILHVPLGLLARIPGIIAIAWIRMPATLFRHFISWVRYRQPFSAGIGQPDVFFIWVTIQFKSLSSAHCYISYIVFRTTWVLSVHCTACARLYRLVIRLNLYLFTPVIIIMCAYSLIVRLSYRMCL